MKQVSKIGTKDYYFQVVNYMGGIDEQDFRSSSGYFG